MRHYIDVTTGRRNNPDQFSAAGSTTSSLLRRDPRNLARVSWPPKLITRASSTRPCGHRPSNVSCLQRRASRPAHPHRIPSPGNRTTIRNNCQGTHVAADIDDRVVNVRFLVEDVQAAVDFYTTHLGFTLRSSSYRRSPTSPAASLRLLVAGPASSAGRAMPDGRRPVPGGWNRIHLIAADYPPMSPGCAGPAPTSATTSSPAAAGSRSCCRTRPQPDRTVHPSNSRGTPAGQPQTPAYGRPERKRRTHRQVNRTVACVTRKWPSGSCSADLLEQMQVVRGRPNSVILPASTRYTANSWVLTTRPVAGTPRKFPRCVPVSRK